MSGGKGSGYIRRKIVDGKTESPIDGAGSRDDRKEMTVGELIQHLSKYSPEASVWGLVGEDMQGFWSARLVEVYPNNSGKTVWIKGVWDG